VRPQAVGHHIEQPFPADRVARRVAQPGGRRLENRDQVGGIDVVAHRAGPLGATQHDAERGMQFLLQRPGDRDGLGQVALDGGLVPDPGQQAEEGGARVGGPGALARVRDEIGDPRRDHRLEQRLLGGEVPVHGAGADTGPGGDLVERHVVPGRGESLRGRAEDLLLVAPAVSPQRPVSHSC
jgi:hypothetical protein